jgi:hypothetical protein
LLRPEHRSNTRSSKFLGCPVFHRLGALHTITACRGAIDALISEVIEGHIRFHVVDPDHHPTSERAKAAQELIDVIKMYMK